MENPIDDDNSLNLRQSSLGKARHNYAESLSRYGLDLIMTAKMLSSLMIAIMLTGGH
jgi:hypothetical protein